MDAGIIFPGQYQSKGKKGKKEVCHVQLKYEVSIWHLREVIYLNLIWGSLAFSQDHVSGEAFFHREMYIQGPNPWSMAAIWVVRMSWNSLFHEGSRAVFVLSDSISGGWEKIGHINS